MTEEKIITLQVSEKKLKDGLQMVYLMKMCGNYHPSVDDLHAFVQDVVRRNQDVMQRFADEEKEGRKK